MQVDIELSKTLLNTIDLLYTHTQKNILPELEKNCKLNDLTLFNKTTGIVNERSNVKKILKSFFLKNPPVDLQFVSSTIIDKETCEKTIVLTFKGSQEAIDWVTNFSIRKEEFFETDVKVHHGFQRSVALFEEHFKSFCKLQTDELFSNLYTEVTESNTKIILTGHSLGGALATLAACRFYDLGIPSENLTVYTFGAPPIGSKRFVEKYNGKIKIHRFVNTFDFVSYIGKVLNFFKNYQLHHLGEEIILPSNEGEHHSLAGYIDNIGEYTDKT